MICTDQSAPATPVALLPTAAISPAVNVPWPSWSIGIVGVGDEVPADQVVGMGGVAVLGRAVGPAAGGLSGQATADPLTTPPLPLSGSIFPGPWLIATP